MEKIKKITAAILAMSLACGMMASCGDSNDSKDDSKTEIKVAESAAAADESTADESAADESATADESAVADESAAAEPASTYTPQYEYQGYDAFLMFADTNWFWGNWKGQGNVHNESDFDETDPASYGYGVDADIVGDGEYTVAITKDSIAGNNGYTNTNMDANLGTDSPATGTVVFCVDIIGICDGNKVSGKNKETGEWEVSANEKNKLKEGDNHYDNSTIGDYDIENLKVEVTSIKCDGKEVEFDASKIRYGNIEDNNNCYRIEIYNSYGATAEDPAFDPLTAINFAESLEVTFTIEGLGEVKTFPEVDAFTPAQ